ncbi:MAG: c-type cytochrome domain-containing protein, partial [Acidobacteriota bacterium]
MRRVLLLLCGTIGPLAAAPSFHKDVQPLLQKHCQGCHQPASKAANLDVTSYEAFAKGGQRGPAFVAGQPEQSLTIRYL